MKTAAAVLIVLTAALLPANSPIGGDDADEYEIKAAMYANLLRLVDWPQGKFGDAAAPLVIGVTGSEEMARALERIARTRASAGRRIIVRRITGTAGVDECHSVFIGGGDRKKIEDALLATGKNPVLTVGESDRFVALGGMIDLSVSDDRVQIEVSLDIARNAGLAISSQLLKIAIVKTGGDK